MGDLYRAGCRYGMADCLANPISGKSRPASTNSIASSIGDFSESYRAYCTYCAGVRVVTDEPSNNGRTTGGTFAPGNRYGRGNRGSRHRVTRAVEALLEGQHEALTQKAIELALQGDGPALRLCLDRIAPVRKDAPLTFSLPPITTAADTVTASSSLLAAVAEGEVIRPKCLRGWIG